MCTLPKESIALTFISLTFYIYVFIYDLWFYPDKYSFNTGNVHLNFT